MVTMRLILLTLMAVTAFAGTISKDPVHQTKCGVPAIPPDTSSNIIGGKDAIPYSWPWQVVLCKKFLFGCQLSCGGTLISDQWIMTAAHCVRNNPPPSIFRIKLGVFNQTRSDEIGEQVLEITEIHVHPKFNVGDGKIPPTYDIALLKLKNPVQFTDHISPVCLPKKQNEEIPDANVATFITGWGRTINRYTAETYRILQQVGVPIVSKEDCRKFIFGKDYSHVIFCVGFDIGNKLSCNGDSGGPAVFQDPTNNGQWTQIGITSFGMSNAFYPCAGKYSAYSRVSAYVDFIHKYVKDF